MKEQQEMTPEQKLEEKRKKLLEKYVPADASDVPPRGPGRPGGPGGPGRRGARGMAKGKPKNTKETIGRLLTYISEDKAKLAVVFFCVLLNTGSMLGGSYILRPVINNLVKNDISNTDKLKNLVIGLVIMAGIYLVGIIASYM